MKSRWIRILPVRFALFALLFASAFFRPAAVEAAPGAADARIVAVSPAAGARLIRPETSILLRYDRDAGLEGLLQSGLIRVRASVSGLHEGSLRLMRDGSGLLFYPAVPFTLGERVTVDVAAAASRDPGRLGPSRTFEFDIASVVPVDVPAPSDYPLPSLVSPAAFSRPALQSPDRAFATDSLPGDFPVVSVQLMGTPAPGVLFLSNMSFGPGGTNYLMVLDNDGQPLWYQPKGLSCTDFKRQETGQVTYFDGPSAEFTVLDSMMEVADTWRCGNGYTTDLHELRLLQDGHALMLSYDPEIVDMSAVVAGGDTAAVVLGLILQELDKDKNVVFQWRSWDHFQLTDCLYQDLTAHYVDYVHGNAIEVDGDGNLLLSSRHMSEITKIDRTTGDILWRWGGLHNEFTFVGDTLRFSYQHHIRHLENGNYTLFDNGDNRDSLFSRACEYTLDEVGRTATLVWSYRNDPDSYGWAMGAMQRLPNGNTLISYGTGKPDAIEVAPDGSKVMELTLPVGMSSYRVFRCEWTPPVAAVGDVGTPPEIQLLGPNPVRGATMLFARLPRGGLSSMRVFDVQGRVVATPLPPARREAGMLSVSVDLGARPAGLYFCRLEHEGRAVTRSLVLVH